MIIAPMENIAQILIVLVLATAAIIIMKRDIRSLIKTYAFQSLLLAVMALLFFVETGSTHPSILSHHNFGEQSLDYPTLHGQSTEET